MTKKQRYSKDFKFLAAKLVVKHGYTYQEAARRLGTTDWSVRQWVTVSNLYTGQTGILNRDGYKANTVGKRVSFCAGVL